ncbi:hypothetical protein Q8F55_008603 [Vanrija albida]|uniref:Homologous-pairing protein 2 winged helix domain-containing protein n=1 Tax=Vanrija albida TaxID=181172 RepID=A0ABR3PRL6_9TREE
MPPKKDKEAKEKPIKGDQAEEMVLQYLRSVRISHLRFTDNQVNRPYASTDVSTNLKNKVTKPEAQKALLALADKGQLTMKLYGKQSIFVYNQSRLPVLDPDAFASLDAQTKEVQGTLDERRKELKTVMEALPKTKELGRAIERIGAENTITLAALAPFRGDGEAKVDPMSAADRDVIDKGWVRWRKEWTDRKKMYKSIMGMLSDAGLVANQAEFEDNQGVEVDDDEAAEVDRGEFGSGAAVIRKVAAGGVKPLPKSAPASTKAKPAAAPVNKVLGKRTRSESASQEEEESGEDDE